MNKKGFNVSLSIKDNNAKIIRGIVRGDNNVLFNIQLLDGKEPFDFSGHTQMVLNVMLPDGNTVYSDGLKSTDLINPSEGLLCFSLPLAFVSNVGMHYLSIEVHGNDAVVNSARLNYYVDEKTTDYEEYLKEQEKDGERRYTALEQALAKIDKIINEDSEREMERRELIALMANMTSAVENAITYCELTDNKNKYLLNQMNNIKSTVESLVSHQINGTDIDFSNLVTKTEINNYDCGSFTNKNHTLHLLYGSESNLPSLEVGEMGFCVDTNKLYVGGATKNICINDDNIHKSFVVSDTAPDDKTVLWIDLKSKTIKYFNENSGYEWVVADQHPAVFV